jgi:hypothetical protein
MANGAQGLMDRVISMSLLKRLLAAVMTAEAERSFRFYQQTFLVRTVGGVAGRAPFWSNLMDHFLFKVLLFMTLKAGFVALRF